MSYYIHENNSLCNRYLGRHVLFDLLFPQKNSKRAVTFGDTIADKKQWAWMTISNYNR